MTVPCFTDEICEGIACPSDKKSQISMTNNQQGKKIFNKNFYTTLDIVICELGFTCPEGEYVGLPLMCNYEEDSKTCKTVRQ